MKNAILFSVFSSFLMCNASHDIDCIKDRELQDQQVKESKDKCKRNQIRRKKDAKEADCNFDNMSCFWTSSEPLIELVRELALLGVIISVTCLITSRYDSSPTL